MKAMMNPIDGQKKRCCSCTELREIAQYSVDRSQPDGHCKQCKRCHRRYYLQNRGKRIAAAIECAKQHAEVIRQRQHARYIDNRDAICAKQREYYRDHLNDCQASLRAYASAHKAEAYERNKRWRLTHLPYSSAYKKHRLDFDPAKRRKQNEQNRNWAHRNPALVRLATLRRETRQQLAGAGHYTVREWEALLVVFGHRCALCDIHANDTKEGHLEKDHIIPLSSLDSVQAGPLTPQQMDLDLITNIQPLCKPCNIKKGVKTLDGRVGALQRLGCSHFLDETSRKKPLPKSVRTLIRKLAKLAFPEMRAKHGGGVK